MYGGKDSIRDEEYGGNWIEEVYVYDGTIVTGRRTYIYESFEDFTRGRILDSAPTYDAAKAYIDKRNAHIRAGYPAKPKYSDNVMRRLRLSLDVGEMDKSRDDEINTMSKGEALDRCLVWEGIIGYTPMIIGFIKSIYGVDLGS